MTSKEVVIRTSLASDIPELLNTLREKDRIECTRFGMTPEYILDYAFRNGITRFTGLIDGKVAAMWGICGSLLSTTGVPYLLTGTEIEKISALRVARIYKKEVDSFLKIFGRLENYVDAAYEESIKMLELQGFTVDKEIVKGFRRFYKELKHV